MLTISTVFRAFRRGLPSAVVVAAALILINLRAGDVHAQSANATLTLAQGQSVTLTVNGVPQVFNAGDTIDLSQNISIPATAAVSFAFANGATIAPLGGSSFSVDSDGTNVNVNLTDGAVSAASGDQTGTVSISNGNGVSITGSDITSSFDPATQESTVEVNAGTATLSGSATNGGKTFTANNITLNANDTNQRVFNVSFADGANQNTNSGFRTAANSPNANLPNPNLPNVNAPPPVSPVFLPFIPVNFVPPAQVDSSSPVLP